MINYPKSTDLYNQALHLFPGGVNSPVRAFRSVYGTPLFIEKGDGCHIWDADGNKFIDFCCSWGPLILGHNPPTVRKEIIQAVEKGTSFGTPNKYAVELGKLIIKNNRFIDKIRFVNSGTEAVMSAVRLARGYTGKNKIIKFEGCYHGHVDHLMVKAGSGLATFGTATSAGVPDSFTQETIVLPLNNTEALKKAFSEYKNDIAAAIIEPIPANNGLLLQDKVFLNELRDICHQHDSLLIFDEVISGFRVGFEGAAGLYNIQPDIVTYGKIIGGGMPVGAYGAAAHIMSIIAPDGPVYQAGTLSGNPVAMAAGLATVQACLEEGFYSDLASKTQQFTEQVNEQARQHNWPVHLFNVGSIFWIAFTEKNSIQAADEIATDNMHYFKELHQMLLTEGVYIGPSGYEVGFVSRAHTPQHLETAANIIISCLQKVFAATPQNA